jgi:predicted permease
MSFGHDLRLAVRSLRAGKGPLAIATITLALGIGITTAVFSVLDAIVVRPVPFPDAHRLVELWNFETKSQVSHPGFPLSLFAEWRRQRDLFDRVEGYETASSIYAGSSGAEMVTGATVTPGLFAMLGAEPVRGRAFVEGDGRGGTDDRLIVSDAFWRRVLGRRADVVGSTLQLDQRTFTVVGVMPASFRFPNEAIEFWRPIDPEAPPPGGPAAPRLAAFARLTPGMSIDAATERVAARGADLVKTTGGPDGRTARLHAAGRQIDTKMRLSLWILAGAVGFLLLIVCANLAGLALTRSLTRARDFAVRASLGATRRDLLREVLLEHAIVGAAGVAGGIAIAAGLLEFTQDVLPRGFRLSSMNAIDLDLRTLAFATGTGLFTLLLFGLPPAWLASRPSMSGLLGRQSRSFTPGAASRRLRGALVVVEVTLAIVLLTGTALMARSLVKLQSVDRGFDATGLIAMRVGLPRAGYADVYARDAFTELLLERLRRLPGVTSATAGSVPPDTNMVMFGKIESDAKPGELSEMLDVPAYQVWPNYFSAVGLELKEGRPFTDGDSADTAIVSQSFARRFYGDTSPVGRRFRFEGDDWMTIAGVATEVRQFTLDDSAGSFEIFFPLKRPAGLPQPRTPGSGAIVSYRTVVVRADDVSATMLGMRAALHDVDPRVVAWRTDSVERLFADAIARPRIVLLAMLTFAGLGLFLAAAGVYGVLSHSVVQRRREMGIRLALGARPAAVGALIARNGLALTTAGLVAGIGIALAFTGAMRSLLYEVEPTDPLSIVYVAGLLLGVAAIACWHPVRRAMRIDPASLLREE